VLVTGGITTSTGLRSVEFYDPATQTWTSTGTMATPRHYHTATLLSDGKVLVSGGNDTIRTAERYDPATQTWTSTGTMATPRRFHTATLLPDGKVLVSGGRGASSTGAPPTNLKTAERYNPATNTWSATPAMSTTRSHHTATLLPNGKVLVTGGFGGSGTGVPLASAELYDPTSNTWSSTGAMASPRRYHTATLLPSGKVLVAGGYDGTSDLASAELYDPNTGTWAPTACLAQARHHHTATPLPSGEVLLIGGEDGMGRLTSAERYKP
jgi:WD40 repeat protein